MLIINADDWGRSKAETDIPLESYRQGRITSITAMVFMADSQRAADIALNESIPTGLHLNFIEPFSADSLGPKLVESQQTVIGFLTRSRFSQLLYNPLLARSFQYLFQAQLEEFCRLYDRSPTHFDGHKHMHLCANMLISRPIPSGEKVRRTFFFAPDEKGIINRSYRTLVNLSLARRYRVTDYFFALSQQLSAERLARVCRIASTANVELMTHPAVPDEAAFLRVKAHQRSLEKVAKGSYADL